MSKYEILEEMPFKMDLEDLICDFKQQETKVSFDNSKFNFKKAYNKEFYKKKVKGLPDKYYDILEKYS